MNLKLYEIAEEIRAVLDNAEYDENGEFTEEFKAELQVLADSLGLDKKLCSIAGHIKEAQGAIEAMKKAEKDISERRKALENENDKWRQYILNCTEMLDEKRIENEFVRITLNKPRISTEIIDESCLPNGYFDLVRSPKKDMIKKALEEGQEIAGARLMSKRSITIK